MENIVDIVRLYRENKITQYAFEQSLSSHLGSMSEVRIHSEANATTTTSFGIFVVPEFHVNGVKVVYYIDKDVLFNNFYTDEELIKRLEKIAAMKQAIIKEAFRFSKDHEHRAATFGEAMACLLRIYQSTLDILKVEDRDFLPSEEKIAKIVNDFEDGKGIDENLEELFISNVLPREIVDTVKEMSHDSPEERITTLNFVGGELPSFNLGQQEISQYCTGTFGTREHKEIPYDYKPSTNQ